MSTDATAATITVTSTADNGTGSLRQAIQSASPVDTINFSVTGIITLTNGEFLVTNNLAIVGPGAASLAISGNTNSRIFEIGSNVTASISGLTLRDGHAPDGLVSGASGQSGGGIYNSGTLTLVACVVSGNSSGNGYSNYYGVLGGVGVGGGGGGICNVGNLILSACTVTGNTGGRGGHNGVTAGGKGGGGGGICNLGAFTIIDCTLSGNQSGSGGTGGVNGFRGLYGEPGGDGSGGGAIYNEGTVTLTNCTMSGNEAGAGGSGGVGLGVGGQGGNGGSGGAIYSTGVVSLTACTVSANGTGPGGAGGTTPRGAAGGNGGNRGRGGGVCNAAGTSFVRLHSTLVAGNFLGAGGAGGTGQTNGLAGSVGSGPDLFGSFTSQGYNLIGQTNGSTGLSAGVNADIAGSTNAPVNPMLGPLQDNGGPTFTMALLAGSPALNEGDDALLSAPFNVTTDQRGLPRKSGPHVDIGAYEFQVIARLSAALLADAKFHFTLVGEPRTTYAIQASTDFLSWTDLTNLISADGTNIFIDTSAPSFGQRFYRAVVMP